jgi:hypothetical protein
MRGTNAPRWRAWLALFSIFTVALLAFAGQASAGIDESSPLPSISSDKSDYAPGETVTLSGSFWAAGESVHVVVNDDAGQIWRYENDVTAGADGSFSLQFNLPELFVSAYTATASGASGTATTSFTDANLKFALATIDNAAPSNVAWSVNWDQWNGTGQNPNTTCNGTRSLTGTANYSGNTLSSGTEPGINNIQSAKPTSADTSGAVADTYELNYWSSSPTSTTPLTAAQLCQAGQNGPTVFTFYAHFKLSDAIAPTTTASASPAANAAGWNKTNVTVGLSATDNAGGSGVKEITYSASGAQTIASTTVGGSSASGISITAEGETTLSFFAKDNAGNTEATKTLVLKIDKTAPAISDLGPTTDPNAAGWYNHDVVNQFKASDGLSGLDAACQAAFPDEVADGRTQDKTTSGEGMAVKVSSDSCTDAAGNTAAAVDSAAFKVDKTEPTVVINLARDPDHNGWYNHGLGYRPVGSDALSDIASCQPGALYTAPDSASASVSRTCTDNAGNVGTGSRSFMFDATDPSVTVNLARDPDRNGWYNHPVGYRPVGTDDTSGLDSCETGALYAGPDGEPVTVTRTCTDNAGNEGVGARSFDFDDTDPSIVATLSPPANDNGWNNTDVTVSFTCADSLSGIDPAYGCPADQTLTSQGLHTLHVATSDVAGNVVTPSFDVRIDKTDPSISGSAAPPANANGWNNTDVVVSFSCFDGLSEIDFCEPNHTLSSNGAGQSVTGDARDKAGNEASATVSGINIDKLPPSVVVTGVANGATYTLGSVAAAGCDTTDQAGLSGVDTPASVSVSGPASGVGSFTATCSGATDEAGNSAAPVSVTYTVVYNWTGFFQPIDNNPDQSGNPALATVWNSAKAGQAIPVKFSLHGNQGLSIFAADYPKTLKVTCPSAAPVLDTIETYTSSTPGLTYDAIADQYNYVWKSTSTVANTCQRLEVKLVDGTSHYAFFKFLK